MSNAVKYRKSNNLHCRACGKSTFQNMFKIWGGGGEFSMPDAKWGKIQKKKSTHCRACGTINISKYVNNFFLGVGGGGGAF